MNHFSLLAYSPQVKHMTWGEGGGGSMRDA